MATYPSDIYTEPLDVDTDTLKNLGPLTGMAGIWQGNRSLDIPPKPLDAPEPQVFVERFELQPIDPQANGPQLFYGLRYHTRIVKPGEVESYHDQIGYWLWEPATSNLIQTLAIPRGQTAMAFGRAAKDASRVSHQGYDQLQRHVGLRRRHDNKRARPVGAVPSHRSQPSDKNRRADAQSACPSLTN